MLRDARVHYARTVAANWCNASRQAIALAFRLNNDAEQSLRDNGFSVVPEFLPRKVFSRVHDEAVRALDKVDQQIPMRQRIEPGFGPQEPNPWGFDRYDGATLNRFVDIQSAEMPSLADVVSSDCLKRLCRVGLGMRRPPRRPMIYLTVNGDETLNHDIQKDLHRDSYFRKMKYWFFLEPVSDTDSPFVYVPGSHVLTRERLHWEYEQARELGIPDTFLDSSFRIQPSAIDDLGLPSPRALTVAANTLVVADTFGFHRRGDAVAGSRRVALYGQKKPWPFMPVGI